ncbi:cytochrome c [Acidipila sp. EB88]|uniref:c-type cytochrome n=1 Tax=Acidipila sp. EB88 TaxID=2305226 RepID=UPI00131515A6|nr:cytochrome c [Acidipila sp. EB88]
MTQRSFALFCFLALVMMCPAFASAAAVQATAPASPASTPASQGQQQFATAGCEHCHGENGKGTERAPALLNVGKRLTAAQIVSQIHDGGKSMPAFSDLLDADQIASLVAYLQTLHPHKTRPRR